MFIFLYKDDDSNTDKEWEVDGAYAPRIFFISKFVGLILHKCIIGGILLSNSKRTVHKGLRI